MSAGIASTYGTSWEMMAVHVSGSDNVGDTPNQADATSSPCPNISYTDNFSRMHPVLCL